MKNKIKPFDVSILSMYMGRWLTAVIAVVVVSLAISAFLSRGNAEHNIINICVRVGVLDVDARAAFEPLRTLLVAETRRPVVLFASDGVWPGGCDLYVMPIGEYLSQGQALGLEALYEVVDSDDAHDSAVLISRSSAPPVDFAALAPSDVAFAHPKSINGFWVQVARMAEQGFDMSAAAGALCFEGSVTDGTPTVFAVLYGACRVGACKMTELAQLSRRGLVESDDFRIIARDVALPEVVLAAPTSEAAYYRRKLEGVARLLQEPLSPARQSDTVELLRAFGVRRLEPIGVERLGRARELYRRYGSNG